MQHRKKSISRFTPAQTTISNVYLIFHSLSHLVPPRSAPHTPGDNNLINNRKEKRLNIFFEDFAIEHFENLTITTCFFSLLSQNNHHHNNHSKKKCDKIFLCLLLHSIRLFKMSFSKPLLLLLLFGFSK